MFFLLSLILLVLADDPTVEEDSSDKNEEEIEADEEIIVYGQSEVDRRRNLLDKNIRANGYRIGKKRQDKVFYRPEVVWKPTIVVYDSGFIDLRKTPPRFEPWIRGYRENKWRYLACIPPLTVMCVQASGWLITKRRAQHSKTETIKNNIDVVQAWQESITVVATQVRLEEDIPDILDNIWFGDSSLSKQERKEQILNFWTSRTCTPEGNQAAKVIGYFIEMEIQSSAVPLTTNEQSVANHRNPCQRSLTPGETNKIQNLTKEAID